jgi:hypothetical protein
VEGGEVRRRVLELDGGEGNRPDEPPEVELWVEVVARAVADLGMWFYVDKYSRKQSRFAARWLFGPMHRKDFLLVCEYACLCPVRVEESARRLWLSKVPVDWTVVQNELWKEVVRC